MSIQYTRPGFEPTTFEHESPPITTRPGLPPPSSQNLKRLFLLLVLLQFIRSAFGRLTRSGINIFPNSFVHHFRTPFGDENKQRSLFYST